MCELIADGHNAGFFSHCSMRLYYIIDFFNKKYREPLCVDSSKQFRDYKTSEDQDLTSLYFKSYSTNILEILYQDKIDYHWEHQFIPYRNLNLKSLIPFIRKYFTPSETVQNYINEILQKYSIDTEKLVAVIYRGNDKCTETKLAPYSEFINKAKEIKERDKNITFIVQSDEREFIEEFCAAFNDTVVLDVLPTIHRNPTAVVHAFIPLEDRPLFGVKIFSVFNILSKCKYVITHSGNCGIWTIFLRGNTDNIFQYLNPLHQTLNTNQQLWV